MTMLEISEFFPDWSRDLQVEQELRLFSIIKNHDMPEEMLTSEGGPSSSLLPSELPALADCRGAAWIACAVER